MKSSENFLRNMMGDLRALKNIGHDLLDQYIRLDYSYRNEKQKIVYAYEKLANKINKNPHFSKMTNRTHALDAVFALQEMIKKRKKKRELFGIDKVMFAPNLMEIQRRNRK